MEEHKDYKECGGFCDEIKHVVLFSRYSYMSVFRTVRPPLVLVIINIKSECDVSKTSAYECLQSFNLN